MRLWEPGSGHRGLSLSECMRVSGIDLSVRRETVVAILDRAGPGGNLWRLSGFHSLSPGSLQVVPHIIRGSCIAGIDAPLHRPYRGFREVERRAMKLYGARLLPGGMRSMQALSGLGLALASLLSETGIEPVETHPYSASSLSGIEIGGLRKIMGRDRADSLLCGVTAASIVSGCHAVISSRDGLMALPTRAKIISGGEREGLSVELC